MSRSTWGTSLFSWVTFLFLYLDMVEADRETPGVSPIGMYTWLRSRRASRLSILSLVALALMKILQQSAINGDFWRPYQILTNLQRQAGQISILASGMQYPSVQLPNVKLVLVTWMKTNVQSQHALCKTLYQLWTTWAAPIYQMMRMTLGEGQGYLVQACHVCWTVPHVNLGLQQGLLVTP